MRYGVVRRCAPRCWAAGAGAGVCAARSRPRFAQGVRTDTYHTDCFNDNASVQSACGFSNAGFEPDGRSNEEWYGLYNVTYPRDSDLAVELHPRPAVAALQALWSALDAAAPPAPDARRARRRGADAVPRPAEEAYRAPGVYQTIFPTQISDHFSVTFLVLGMAIPVGIMVLLVAVPYVPFPRRFRTPDTNLEANMQRRISTAYRRKSVILEGGGNLQALERPEEALPNCYEDLAFFVNTISQFFWLMLSDRAHAEFVVQSVIMAALNEWRLVSTDQRPITIDELEDNLRCLDACHWEDLRVKN